MDPTQDFLGRTLVLTGAAGGIGRATARRFLARGANLVLADREDAALQALAQELEEGDGAAGRIAILAMDAAQPADAAALVALAVRRFGAIDFLVPSAGIYRAQPFESMTDEQWRQTLSINLDGVFYLVRRALPHLADGSAVVFLSSMAAHRGAFYNAHYSASKGALISLARSLARELGPRTRVNAVSPGIIATPMTQDLIKARGAESAEQTPLKRLGQPAEVASVIAFLCGQDASFVTGEVMHVNGGLYMD